MRGSKSNLYREVHSDTGLHQKLRKISSKQLKLPPKELEEQSKHKVSRRKEIIKIREEITKIEAKNTIEKSIKQGVDFF